MSRYTGFLFARSPQSAARAATFVDGFAESDDAEVINIVLSESDKSFIVFFSAQSEESSKGIVRTYLKKGGAA